MAAWNKFFICRIKANTQKSILKEHEIRSGSIVFFDAIVILGSPNINQIEIPLRLVGYQVGSTQYWIAANRCDLTAEQTAAAYIAFPDLLNYITTMFKPACYIVLFNYFKSVCC